MAFKKSNYFLTYFNDFGFYKKVRPKRVKDDTENLTLFMDRSTELLHNVSDVMGRLQEDIRELREAIQTADESHRPSDTAGAEPTPENP